MVLQQNKLFLKNLLFNGKNELKNRYCHIRWSAEAESQSAIPKCQNVTLEESAILNILAQSPKTTQKQLAVEIKKSERTVKRIMDSLQKKNLIYRKDGKRNGSWIFSSLKKGEKNTKK